MRLRGLRRGKGWGGWNHKGILFILKFYRFYMVSIKKGMGTKKILESENNPRYEGVFIKYFGQEPINIAKERFDKGAKIDYKKLGKVVSQNPDKKYNFIHTHPYYSNPEVMAHAPLKISDDDWEHFLKDDNAKSMTIAQRDTRTTEVRGSVTISKTKATPAYINNPIAKENSLILRALSDYEIEACDWSEGEKIINALKNVSSKLHLRAKYIPAKGFHISTEDMGHFDFERNGSLESKVAGLITTIGLLSSIVFFSINLTGNAISNLTTKTNSFLGVCLFVVGLVAGFFWLYYKKK